MLRSSWSQLIHEDISFEKECSSMKLYGIIVGANFNAFRTAVTMGWHGRATDHMCLIPPANRARDQSQDDPMSLWAALFMCSLCHASARRG